MSKVKSFKIKGCTHQNYVESFFLIILVLQVGAIVIFNFTKMKDTVDYDSMVAFTQAMEICKQKSLNLVHWGYQTTAGWDSGIPVAAIIYGVTNNIFFSFAISNCAFLALYIFVINRICIDINLSKIGKYITLNLLFIPYTWGQLGYIQMLFTSGAFYNIRVLLPLMMLSIVLRIYKRHTLKNQVGMCLVTYFFLFLAGCSSKVYELICCVTPFFVAVFVDILLEDKLYEDEHISGKVFREPQLIYIIGSVVASVLGLLVGHLMQIPVNPPATTLSTLDNFWENFGGFVMGLFEIFGGLPLAAGIEAVSFEGIGYLLCFIFVIVELLGAVFLACQKNKTHKCLYLILNICVINCMVLLLANMTYGSSIFESRYHLLWMIPMFLIPGQLVDCLKKTATKSFYNVMIFIFAFCLIFVNVSRYHDYFKLDNNYTELERIIFDVKNTEKKILYIVGDSNIRMGRMMKPFASDIDIVVVESGIEKADSWGASTRYFDNAVANTEIAILIDEEELQNMPIYKKKDWELVKKYDFNNVMLYTSNRNDFDFLVGFPDKEQTRNIDFPYSPGYICNNAQINEEGYLVSDGNEGVVLFGPYSKTMCGLYNITINYKINEWENEEPARFSVETDYTANVINDIILDAGEVSITLNDIRFEQESNTTEFKVYAKEGTIIEIQSLEFEKID